MHATLLTLLLVSAGEEPPIDGQRQATRVVEDCDSAGCSHCCRPAGRCCFCATGVRRWLPACLRPMCHDCCAPGLHCCPGDNRCLHSYAGFYGHNYRQAYNYRLLFDYPWHSPPHQPRCFFTYQGGAPTVEEIHRPTPEQGAVPSETLPQNRP